jgi:cytochrome c-type biogenesis protein CcmE
MNPKYLKFAGLITVIVGTLAWLAVGGIKDTQTYYKTVSELQSMSPEAKTKRLRVAGDVAPGTIVRRGREVEFVLTQADQNLRVVYNGSDPLPDTFRDRAQAVADGKLGDDGVFRANRIQAKCASKYEAKPGGKGDSAPVYTGKKVS